MNFNTIRTDPFCYQGITIRLPETNALKIEHAVTHIVQSNFYKGRIRALSHFRSAENLTDAISYLTKMSLDAPYFLLSLTALPEDHTDHLDAEDFATLMIFWQVMKESGVERCSFVDFAQKGDSLRDALMHMVRKNNFSDSNAPLTPFLSINEENKLLETLQVSPLLKRMAIVVDQEKEVEKNIRDRIIEINGAVLGVNPYSGEKMMPSIGLVTRIFAQAFKDDTLRPKIVIGTSSSDAILEGEMQGYRDLAIEFPFAPLPKVADHYPVLNPSDFILHDLYHLLAASSIPSKDRLFFLDLANRLSCVKEPHNGVKKACEVLRNKCIDLDFGYFRYYREEIKNGKIQGTFVQYLELIRHLCCSFKEIEKEMELSPKEFELLRNSTIKYLIDNVFTKQEKSSFSISSVDKKLDRYLKTHNVFQSFLNTN